MDFPQSPGPRNSAPSKNSATSPAPAAGEGCLGSRAMPPVKWLNNSLPPKKRQSHLTHQNNRKLSHSHGLLEGTKPISGQVQGLQLWQLIKGTHHRTQLVAGLKQWPTGQGSWLVGLEIQGEMKWVRTIQKPGTLQNIPNQNRGRSLLLSGLVTIDASYGSKLDAQTCDRFAPNMRKTVFPGATNINGYRYK